MMFSCRTGSAREYELTFSDFKLIMIVAYFKCGEGVQGKTNSKLWGGLISFVTGVNHPCIIMGDFNITPGEFMATTIGTVMQVQMVATGEETCSTGNELDWALATNQISPDLVVKVCWEVPFKPHAQLNFKLNVATTALTVQQITRYNPAPKLEKSTKEWDQFEQVECPVKWLDMEDDHISKKAGAIYGKIEAYVLQHLDKPATGRGTRLQFQQKPLSDPSKPWIWKKGSLSYWNQMELRLQQVLQKKTMHPADLAQLQKLGWHINQHWHDEGPIELEGFQVLFQMLWGHFEPEHGQALLMYAKQQRELHFQSSTAADTETYREWLANATLKRHRGLFRSLKQEEQPFLRPFQQLPREERMEQRTQQWTAIWGQRQENHKVTSLPAMIDKGKEHAAKMKPIRNYGEPSSSFPTKLQAWTALDSTSSRPSHTQP